MSRCKCVEIRLRPDPQRSPSSLAGFGGWGERRKEVGEGKKGKGRHRGGETVEERRGKIGPISVGAQSTLGGKTFLPENTCMKT